MMCVEIILSTFIAPKDWKQSANRVPTNAANMALNLAPALSMDVVYSPSGLTSANLKEKLGCTLTDY
jgi:hypothetical protein